MFRFQVLVVLVIYVKIIESFLCVCSLVGQLEFCVLLFC